MDLQLFYIIIVVIAAIIIEEVYKRERNRVTTNLHANNLKNLLTITALEYQHSRLDIIKDNQRESIEKKISLLVSSFEKGEMQNSVFQEKMYSLLKKLK